MPQSCKLSPTFTWEKSNFSWSSVSTRDCSLSSFQGFFPQASAFSSPRCADESDLEEDLLHIVVLLFLCCCYLSSTRPTLAESASSNSQMHVLNPEHWPGILCVSPPFAAPFGISLQAISWGKLEGLPHLPRLSQGWLSYIWNLCFIYCVRFLGSYLKMGGYIWFLWRHLGWP